jgi:hypothetical protein
MEGEPPVITYSIEEPFTQAVKSVRRAITGKDLQVTGESSVSGRIWRNLWIGTSSCMVLFVWPSKALGKGLSFDYRAAALAPLHVVVCDHGSHSEVHVLRIPASEFGRLSIGATAVMRQTQMELLEALEKIGIRLALCG